jgi:integrase
MKRAKYFKFIKGKNEKPDRWLCETDFKGRKIRRYGKTKEEAESRLEKAQVDKDDKNLKFVKGENGSRGYYITEITLNYRRIRRFAGYTKEEAKVCLGKLRIAAREGRLDEVINPQRTNMETFGVYADQLLNSAEWKAKRSHRRNRISFNHLNQIFKKIKLIDINPALVRKYMTERMEKDKKSPATVNRELSFLKSVLYAAEYDGLIPSNPIRGRRVKKLEEANSREKAILEMNLTDDVQRRLVECASEELRPILKIALLTGMRQGEILKLKWKDINFRLCEIRIPSENAKSKKERFVPISPELSAELDTLPRKSEYVFYNADTGTHVQYVRRSFKSALEAADIEGLRFHDLRHLAASRLVKVTDVVTASKILGHSSLDMTLRYVHSMQKDRHAAIEKAAENLFRGRQKDVNGKIGMTEEEATQSRLIN